MKIEYLPLLMQLSGVFCLCIAVGLVSSVVIALVVAAVVLLGLGFWLESRRETVNNDDDSSRTT